jgi:hypothetical protein
MLNRIISQKSIVILFSVLAVLLPINNIITQVSTNLLRLPNVVLLWKEALVIILIILMAVSIVRAYQNKETNLKVLTPIFVYCGLVFLALVSSIIHSVSVREIALGFRVELLWVGLLACTVAWSESVSLDREFIKKYLIRSLYGGVFLVLVVTMLSQLFGAQSFYTWLGFSNGWESNGQTILESPICHSIDAAGNGCRLSGGFSNPNNFAGYLLLVLPLFVVGAINSYKKGLRQFQWANFAIIWAILMMILMTFARFAWLALMVEILLGLCIWLYRKQQKTSIKKIFLFVYGAFFVLPFILIGLLYSVLLSPSNNLTLPDFLTKSNSTIAHYKQSKIALDSIFRKGTDLAFTGYGLGQTGPIAKPQYKDVMSSEFAVQNADIAQKYGVRLWEIGVPENWYLQLILNGGWVYAGLYILLIGSILYPLWSVQNSDFQYEPFLFCLGLFGIFLGNTLLHIWENPTIAYYMSIITLLIHTSRSNT